MFIEIFIAVVILLVCETTWIYFRKKYKDQNKSPAFWITIFSAILVIAPSLIGVISGIFNAQSQFMSAVKIAITLFVFNTTWKYFREKYKDQNKSRIFWIGIFFIIAGLIGAIRGILEVYYEASQTTSTMSEAQLTSEVDQRVPEVGVLLHKDPELTHKILEYAKNKHEKGDKTDLGDFLDKVIYPAVLAADDASMHKLVQAKLALYQTLYSHSNQLCQSFLNHKLNQAAALAALPEDVKQAIRNMSNALGDAYVNGKGKPAYSDNEVMQKKLLVNMIREALTPSQAQALILQSPSYEQQACEIQISIYKYMLNNTKSGIREFRAALKNGI